MHDINGIITSHLSLRELPSLRTCKWFYGFRVTLIKQQAIYFGCDETKKTYLEYLKDLFAAIRSINKKATKIVELKMVYTSTVCDILYYLRTISLNEFTQATSTIYTTTELLRPLLMHVMSLSTLTVKGKVDQVTRDRAFASAISFGPSSESVCRKLLLKGADPNSGKDETALHYVIRKGDVNLAKLLIEFQGDPHKITTVTKQSALQIAVEIVSREMVEFLLSIGVEDKPTPSGTAFSDALKNCFCNPRGEKIELAKLLKKQAQIYCRDTDQNTYLHLAMMYNNQPWMLEDYDPTPLLNVQDRVGRTPFHNMVMLRQRAQIQYLVDWGADPTIRDIYGRTVYDLTPRDLLPLISKGNKRMQSQI